MSAPHAVLQVSGLHAFYGDSHVLHGVDLEVREGEVVTLLGRNGAGRSTLLKAVLGILDQRTGSIRVHGRETIGMDPHLIPRLGIGYCPEERGIFGSLSCEENLLLLPSTGPRPMDVDSIYELFPNLWERRHAPGLRLSGGEQQILAMARILRAGHRTLFLDEISEGLAPVIVQSLGRAVRKLRDEGFTILLVEQNTRFAASLADRHLVMEHGRIVAEVARDQLSARADVFREYLSV